MADNSNPGMRLPPHFRLKVDQTNMHPRQLRQPPKGRGSEHRLQGRPDRYRELRFRLHAKGAGRKFSSPTVLHSIIHGLVLTMTQQQEIASKGGQASSGSFEKGSEKAKEAGRKGGQSS